jgi:hypothetical protein
VALQAYSRAAPYGADRQALVGIVQALLITKHMLFIGFSLSDDAFNQVGMTVRRALDPEGELGRERGGRPHAVESPPGDMLWSSAHQRVTDEVADVSTGAAGRGLLGGARGPSGGTFGTALTLSDRPFLSELWPDLDCCAMRPGVAETAAKRMSRSRQLEIFLDYVCFKTSNTAEHL